jgi:UDP-N-acetyl-D-glucosamine dehydrogenase
VFDLQSRDLTAQSIAEFDVVLLATDHDLFDYDLIREHAAVVVDTRGRYRQKFDGLVQA